MLNPARVIIRITSTGGDTGARQVVAEMSRLVRESLRDSTVAALAAAARSRRGPRHGAGGSGLYEWQERQAAVYDLLRSHYRFKPDAPGREQIKTPLRQAQEILERGYAEGDCDDRATLGAALLRHLGQPAYLVLIAQAEGVPFHHVFYASQNPAEVKRGRPAAYRLIPFDPQEGIAPGRWPRWVRRQVFSV